MSVDDSMQVVHHLLERELAGVLFAPVLIFDQSLFQSALADDESVRDADQIHVGEHDAGPLIAVIEQYVEAHHLPRVLEPLRRLGDGCGFVHADRHHADLKRRDGIRPDDAVIVMILLDRGCHRP